MSDMRLQPDDRGIHATFELAALTLIAAACVANLFLAPGSARTAVTLLAALVVPGAAVMTRLPISDPAHGWALVAGLSLTVETVVTLAMVWSGWWHPVPAAAALAGGTAVVLAVDLLRDSRRTQ